MFTMLRHLVIYLWCSRLWPHMTTQKLNILHSATETDILPSTRSITFEIADQRARKRQLPFRCPVGCVLAGAASRNTVAVQTYYSIEWRFCVDVCIDILKNLHTELWRMNNLPLELLHQCTTGDEGQQCNTEDPGKLHSANCSDESRFWPSVGRNRMPSRWHWSAGQKSRSAVMPHVSA